MKKKVFFLLLALGMSAIECEKPGSRPQDDLEATQPEKSDRESNGGRLRLTLQDRAMHDKFFVAQFTPRGALFRKDNLQLYNYNLGSDKYPQFLISIDYEESDLKRWVGIKFPLDFLAFTPSADALPYQSTGQLEITRVDGSMCEGRFSGALIHPLSKKQYAIRGDFKAVLRLNI